MGKLAFSMSKNTISLNGIIPQTYDGKEIKTEFPVLSIKNRYFSKEVKPNESQDSHGQMLGILNCRREDRKLTLEADINYLLIP